MAAARPPRPAYPEPAAAQLLGVLWLAAVASGPWGVAAGSEEAPRCEDLRVGQYICKDPEINDATQEPVNCTNYTAHAPCFPAPNITCKDLRGNETHFTGQEVGFLKPTPCRNVNGYSYKVAVALSLFLGWLGADRFYLGYPALAKHTQEVQALAENASLSQAFPPPSAAACPSWTALLRVEAGPSVCPAQPLARLLSSTVLGERLTD
ncbi:TM2 domain-containing protein 1 isoform X2 [Heterocephalus glaber]|uniref:TM2 domain-containing protein 1 isoform X2 n=1 Tax=Heterocephalus glaber TaxID=10181 RepID=A0AAX6SU32_HETGA|nr:TM2 domain-containing protein 1 isoform X2 [Heterocephalus glaber]